MEPSHSPRKSVKDTSSRPRDRTSTYRAPPDDDTSQRAAGGFAESPRSTMIAAHGTPRSFYGTDNLLPGLQTQDGNGAGNQSFPNSPEPSRRKKLGMSRSVIPNVFSSDEDVANGSPSPKPGRPQTMQLSNGSNKAETFSTWRIGGGRRRSSANNHSKPQSPSIQFTDTTASAPSSSMPLRVQTQPSLIGAGAPIPRPEAISHALAQLNGATTPPPSARTLLSLMKETKGRMHGKCQVQQQPHGPWTPGYCTINTQIGGLAWTSISVDSRGEKFLLRVLRGCRVQALLSSSSGRPEILIYGIEGENIRLRPDSRSHFETWFAALLCWETTRPTESPQAQGQDQLVPLEFPEGLLRKVKEKSNPRNATRKDAATMIKVGKLFYLDPDIVDKNITPVAPRSSSPAPEVQPPWRRVSCTIMSDGNLRLYTTTTLETLAVVRLSQLSRSAIQRLHPSMFIMDHCIAIYPQYTDSMTACSRLRPIYLSFESRVLFEVWFVLLRAFALPEIYGWQSNTDATTPYSAYTPVDNLHFQEMGFLPGLRNEVKHGMFRLERTLHVQIGEARFPKPEIEGGRPHTAERSRSHGRSEARQNLCYVRMYLDGQVKGKTTAKLDNQRPFWYESFELIDLGQTASSITFQVKIKHQDMLSPTDQTSLTHSTQRHLMQTTSSHLTEHQDSVYGEVSIDLNQFENHKEIDKYWPLQDESGRSVGELSLKIRKGEEIILMDADYSVLDEMLGNFTSENALTFQIAEKIPSELTRLSEILLNIYQASNRAEDWLSSLAEEEIDGVRKEAPPGRLRMDSGDSHDSRELQVREENKAALAEANLLFRGNTLLSKALDLHMKRVGKEYLERTLGTIVRGIAEADADCEVDPMRLGEKASLQQNWDRLVPAIQRIWRSIADSAKECPAELRTVFRHIRACAEDRYGERMRSVSYTSISGFLFLRFFCPAVLNPRLFGLLKDNPSPRSQRTFTLLAKSLQGLANQSLFGAKEPWMAPMNNFLSHYRQKFKDFIDSICSVPDDSVEPQLLPSYSAPRAIFSRLSEAAKEGFPKTPYLIDHCRNLSALVSLWMDHNPFNAYQNAQITNNELRQFHKTCTELRLKARSSWAHADRVPSSINAVSERWITIAERIEQAPGEFFLEVDPADSASASAASVGNASPNFSYPMLPEGARSPDTSADSEDVGEQFDGADLPIRDNRRGRGLPATSSPHVASAGRSANSVLSPELGLGLGMARQNTSDSGTNANSTSHSASAVHTPANLSRAPSRAPSSNAASLSDADRDRSDARQSRSTLMPRDRERERDRSQNNDAVDSPGGGRRTRRDMSEKPKERSESRFNLFGMRRKKAKEGESGAVAGRSMDVLEGLRVSYQGGK